MASGRARYRGDAIGGFPLLRPDQDYVKCFRTNHISILSRPLGRIEGCDCVPLAPFDTRSAPGTLWVQGACSALQQSPTFRSEAMDSKEYDIKIGTADVVNFNNLPAKRPGVPACPLPNAARLFGRNAVIDDLAMRLTA